MKVSAGRIAVAAVALATAAAAGDVSGSAVCGIRKDVREAARKRAAALVAEMTPEERVSQLMMDSPPIPRLGIPQTVFSDGPAGVRIDPFRDPAHTVATGFPVGTLLASSWDIDLVERTTAVLGNEVLEYGVDVLLAPGMNIHRNPLNGRNFEYFSEDPLLSGKMAAAYVRGIQGNGTGTSIKHYAVNNQETNRTENDALVSRRALREIYLKNFEIAVKEGKPWTVMSSYNKLNGKYTQQDYELLTTVLRDEWGYDGIVITDWGLKDNTALSVKAGNDLMDPGSDVEIERILAGVRDGSISLEEIDRNVRRILEYVVKTPRFRKYPYSSHPDLKAHALAAREAAAESIVLLRNERHALPLTGRERVALYGVSSENFIAGGTGSGDVTKP
jgi:beta-glucosidase